MTFQVLLHPKAARFIENADKTVRQRLTQLLAELRDSPEEKGERLKGSLFWRLKVGEYRAIYEIDRRQNRVIVLFIGHRRDVYDDFSKLL